MPEARWPNVALPAGAPADLDGGPLDKRTWAVTGNTTNLRDGTIHSDAMARTAVDWTGGLATLNVGFRFLTWTRPVLSHDVGAGNFTYNSSTPGYGKVGGTGAYLDKPDNLFFLSGKLEALDSPGEWWVNSANRTITVWMPDSGHPANRVRLKTKDLCVDIDAGERGAPVHLANLSLVGCTFKLLNCNNCTITDVNNTFPSYHRTVDMRDNAPGPVPAVATIQGDHNRVARLSMRYSNTGGIKIVGSHNVITDSLFEDLTWLGSLDFPAIELGFGLTQPTTFRDLPPPLLDRSNPTHQKPKTKPKPKPLADNTVGNDNLVTRTTVARVGEMGILTSQRSNEVSYCHVHHVGLIGLDSAALHADNSYVGCMNMSLPLQNRPNCSKVWHHNWVHDASEKCVRGDDYNLNLTVHHNVIWDCGDVKERNSFAATGCILKGDYNRFYHNTVFNVIKESGQGDLCVVSAGLSGRGWNMTQQNANSVLVNSVAQNITYNSAVPARVKVYGGLWRDEATIGLVDSAAMDFRLTAASPLRRAGIVAPPYSHPAPDGGNPDIGAYQYGEPRWTAGCTFSKRCS